MTTKKKKIDQPWGWDVGGAEWPIKVGLTVVDIQKPPANYDFIIKDIQKPGWADGLERRRYVHSGRVLRYLEAINYLDIHNDYSAQEPTIGTMNDPAVFLRFAEQLSHLVLPGGVIDLVDFTSHLEVMHSHFAKWEWFVTQPTMICEADEDGYPEESQLFIIAPLTLEV